MTGSEFKRPNQYRRAFDWRISEADRAARQQQISAIVNLASSDFPDILEDFLDISRKRRTNRTAMAKLQIHMLEEIMFQESAVKHYREKLGELEQKLETPETDEHHKQVELCKRELFFYRLYAKAIRFLGDGMAWRSLGYDRAVTRFMAEQATKQTILAEGTIEELREWSYHFDGGTGLAILNALTNCLAIGDVTVVKDDESVEVVEVKKSSSKSSRKIRQKKKMTEVVTILSTGAAHMTDGREVKINILPITPDTGLAAIYELLKEADEKGWASAKISNCLYVEAFDFRNVKSFDAIKPELEKGKQVALREWEERGDYVFDMNTLDVLSFSPNCAPFSVFPFDSRTCVDLLIGAKSYVTYLNVNAVAREFQYRDWNIEKTSEQLFNDGDRETMLAVSKGSFHAGIPPADFMRLQTEALRVKTLIDEYEFLFRLGPTGSEGHSLSLYEGEPSIWD